MKNATHITTAALGALMGIAGIEHGIGEILQGSVAPAGLMFSSWPDSEFFRIVAGEPAMSIIPNLLVTGILAVLFSLAYVAWAIRFIQWKNGGLVLILLAIGMLLVGGGIFPPILGIIVGFLGTRINAPAHPSAGRKPHLGKLWPSSFAVCIVAWLLLFPGINIIGYFTGVNDPAITILLILFAFGSLILTVFSGFAYDFR